MKVRRSIAAAAAAAVLGMTGALLLPAVASAHSISHTLKLISVEVKSVTFTKTTFGVQDTDANTAGKTIGFDDLYVTITGRNSATADVAFDFKGGFLYGTLTTSNGSTTFSGKVTGGTGAYKGAAGTITGKAIASKKSAETITYTT
jgi:hypothetical protein